MEQLEFPFAKEGAVIREDGWLRRILDNAKKNVDEWPEWAKRCLDGERLDKGPS